MARRKRSSWEIQRSVIFALLMRELKTRFGSYRLGYFWALLEPLSHVAVFVVIFGVIMDRTMPGVNYPMFLVTGIMPWLLFSNIVNRGMVAVTSNAALFNYRQVKPMDTIVARVILEALVQLLVFSIIVVVAKWIGVDFKIIDPLNIIMAFSALILFSMGLAISLCIIATLFPELGKIIPMVMRPLYFVSGIFWPLASVPQEYHVYLVWNPVLHVIESVRNDVFSAYQSSGEVCVSYVLVLAVVFLALGMATYRQTSDRLIAT